MKAHWDVLGAIDFTTIDVWTRGGLVTYYLLFVMEIARNLTDAVDGFMNSMRYVLIDRDGKFCPAFHTMLEDSGIMPVLLPPKSPNLNAHIERYTDQ